MHALFQPKPEFLRFALVRQSEFCYQLFAEIAARAFCEQRIFRAQFHATSEIILWLAVLADAHVAGGHSRDGTIPFEKNFRGSKARINLNAERFRLGRQPAANVAERDNEVAVIAHQWWHYEIRQPQCTTARKVIEAIVGDGGLDRCVFRTPVRKKT